MRPFRGGMEFVSGRPLRITPPPLRTDAVRVRLTCDPDPAVEPDQAVRAGQPIGRRGRSTVTSPIFGRVEALTPWADGTGCEVTLEPTDATIPTSIDTLDPPTETNLTTWYAVLRRVGTWPTDGLPFDLVTQLDAARRSRPDTVICIGLDAFPPYADRSSVLMEFADDAVLGTRLIAQTTGARTSLMLSGRTPKLVSKLRKSCRAFRVRYSAVDNVYPAADPTLVIWSHATGRRRLPHGRNPMDVGVCLITPWLAARVARWVTQRRLDVVQPVMLAWPRAGSALTHHWAVPGQPLASLDPGLAGTVEGLYGRCVVGNPMTGRPCEAPPSGDAEPAPVLSADTQLISMLTAAEPTPPEPCISCGWCMHVCPTRLQPFDLARRVDRQTGKAQPAGDALNWCVDCGLCSHVCPSRIPLAQVLRSAQQRGGEQT